MTRSWRLWTERCLPTPARTQTASTAAPAGAAAEVIKGTFTKFHSAWILGAMIITFHNRWVSKDQSASSVCTVKLLVWSSEIGEVTKIITLFEQTLGLYSLFHSTEALDAIIANPQ